MELGLGNSIVGGYSWLRPHLEMDGAKLNSIPIRPTNLTQINQVL